MEVVVGKPSSTYQFPPPLKLTLSSRSGKLCVLGGDASGCMCDGVVKDGSIHSTCSSGGDCLTDGGHVNSGFDEAACGDGGRVLMWIGWSGFVDGVNGGNIEVVGNCGADEDVGTGGSRDLGGCGDGIGSICIVSSKLEMVSV